MHTVTEALHTVTEALHTPDTQAPAPAPVTVTVTVTVTVAKVKSGCTDLLHRVTSMIRAECAH